MSDYADALNSGLHSLTSLVVGTQTLADTLAHVADLACTAIPGADVAGLTLLKNGSPATPIFTDARSPEIDRAQYDAGTGPCLDAMKLNEVMRIDSTHTEDRWPEFSDAARKHGIQSTLSLPMVVDGESVGALNLYATAVIEQAKGMLMAAQSCSADEAFDLLVRASQRSNRKLRDIAQELVDKAQYRRGASPPAGPS